jgi:hypothetical protein
VALARGFEEARREAIREAWSVGGFFCCCWLRVREEEVKARVALVAIDGRDDVFCGWRWRRWRRVCWRSERTQELQTVEFDMMVKLFVGFDWGWCGMCLLLERGIVSLAFEKVESRVALNDLTTGVSLSQISGQPIGAFKRRCWIDILVKTRG